MTSDAMRFELVLIATPEGAGIDPVRLGTFRGSATVGRNHEGDVALEDPTVSFEHATFRSDAEHVFVVSLSPRGSTFVGGNPLPPGTERAVDPSEPFVQIGSFLLEVRGLERTVPVSHPMPLPTNWRRPLLEVRERRGRGRIVLGGEELPLPPKLFRLLLGLAMHTNEPVSRDALIDIIEPDGWVNLDPLVHRLRTVLTHFAAQHPSALNPLGAGHAVSADGADIGKALLTTVRGNGYRLEIPAELVHIQSRK